jgi:hypothetical protein
LDLRDPIQGETTNRTNKACALRSRPRIDRPVYELYGPAEEARIVEHTRAVLPVGKQPHICAMMRTCPDNLPDLALIRSTILLTRRLAHPLKPLKPRWQP